MEKLKIKIIVESARETLEEIKQCENELARLYQTKGVLNSVLVQLDKITQEEIDELFEEKPL